MYSGLPEHKMKSCEKAGGNNAVLIRCSMGEYIFVFYAIDLSGMS